MRRTLQHFHTVDTSTEIDHENLRILTCRNDTPIVAFGAEHPAGVPPRKVQELTPSLHVEHLDVRVIAAAYEPPARAVNMQRAHQAFVSLHLAQALAGVGVPDADHLVVASRGDVPSILRELTAGQALGVALELADLLACLNVPKLDAEVAAA